MTPTYDGNGNLTYDGAFTYCYDTESRLIGVLSSGSCASPGVSVASYAYDARGRRKSKTVGGVTTMYVTGVNDNEVLEYDGATGAVGNWYVYGLGVDAVLSQVNAGAGARQTMIPDVQGSIVATLDAASGVVSKAGYLSFGENPTTYTGSFRYTGRRIDPETGGSPSQPSGLYYYRARTYSPTWGRFLQPDPIGYAGGGNLYAYTNNDPLNRTDPLGLCDNPSGCGSSSGSQLIPTSVISGTVGLEQTASTVTNSAAPTPLTTSISPSPVVGIPTSDGAVGSGLTQTPGSFDGSTGTMQVAAKGPTLFCQNVECGAPTGGVVYPLCPTCNSRLNNGGPPILLENGRVIVKPIEPGE